MSSNYFFHCTFLVLQLHWPDSVPTDRRSLSFFCLLINFFFPFNILSATTILSPLCSHRQICSRLWIWLLVSSFFFSLGCNTSSHRQTDMANAFMTLYSSVFLNFDLLYFSYNYIDMVYTIPLYFLPLFKTYLSTLLQLKPYTFTASHPH